MIDSERWETFNERLNFVEGTNFDAVEALYRVNNWKWGNLRRDGKWVCAVPNASEIKKLFNELVRDLKEMIELDGFPETSSRVSSGRLNLEVDCDGWVDFFINVHP